MRVVPRPTSKGIDNLELCASSLRSEELKNRLRDSGKEVEHAELVYVDRGEREKFHLVPSTKDVGKVSAAEMERLYRQTFVKSTRTRHIYDSLKKACSNDICPLCGQGTVRQLDHYLPVSQFPAYAVTSINLVPTCADCNRIKLAYIAGSAEEQTLHPYFDDVENDHWLLAKVNETNPVALVFFVDPPATWTRTMKMRAAAHFKTFKLGALYATHAAVEVGNLRYELAAMAKGRNWPQKISAHLRGRERSCAEAHQNSWQRATYGALADSTWFCSGGFSEV